MAQKHGDDGNRVEPETEGSAGAGKGGGRRAGRPKGQVQRIGPTLVWEFNPRQISQERLRKGSEAQALAWQAEKAAHALIEALERDLERGALVEDGPMTYDRKLGMVRTRKEKAG